MTGLCALRAWTTVVLIVLLSVASAQDITVQLELGTDRRDRPVLITTVTDANGAPMTRREVEFSFIPDFFPNEGRRLGGNHATRIGSKTTNVAGKAEIRYIVPYTGKVIFEASLLNERGKAEASGQIETDLIREESPVPEVPEIPLEPVFKPLQQVVLGVVVALWLLLLVLTFSTVRGIYRLGKEV